ncbi:hypothetical protein [Nostoc sp. NMS4]|uniref:hypothetical protein n=1 Tax=Nostoc sp. NMS4 TaxID=2815390 RepID=UPI0025CD8B8A|nr:hypothetical protein [Nostoc sp. NMS4]MBN3923041.1 hypothetical protein [Nostoc sp. NMS4]
MQKRLTLHSGAVALRSGVVVFDLCKRFNVEEFAKPKIQVRSRRLCMKKSGNTIAAVLTLPQKPNCNVTGAAIALV